MAGKKKSIDIQVQKRVFDVLAAVKTQGLPVVRIEAKKSEAEHLECVAVNTGLRNMPSIYEDNFADRVRKAGYQVNVHHHIILDGGKFNMYFPKTI